MKLGIAERTPLGIAQVLQSALTERDEYKRRIADLRLEVLRLELNRPGDSPPPPPPLPSPPSRPANGMANGSVVSLLRTLASALRLREQLRDQLTTVKNDVAQIEDRLEKVI